MKKRVKIEGMHCEGCATGVVIALSAKGVKAKVDFSTREAEIEFNPEKLSLEDIKKEIEKLGYTVVGGSGEKKSED